MLLFVRVLINFKVQTHEARREQFTSIQVRQLKLHECEDIVRCFAIYDEVSLRDTYPILSMVPLLDIQMSAICKIRVILS